MNKYTPFIALWVINALVLFLASLVLPANYVLGNQNLSPVSATIVSGLLVTALAWTAKPLADAANFKIAGETNKFLFYWGANSVAVWIAARLAFISGFGISRFYWAIALGLALNMLQWATWRALSALGLNTKK